MSRLAKFSTSFDINTTANTFIALNAGSTRGFTVTAIRMAWEPNDMSGSSDNLPDMSVTRYTGLASGGSPGVVFNHTDGDVADTSVLVDESDTLTLGSDGCRGPGWFPGIAQYSAGWYLYGGQYLTDFNGAPIYVAPGNSLVVVMGDGLSGTVFFYENLTP